MTSSLPPHLEGTQAPSQLEFLWEKHRRSVFTILAAAVVALGLNYGIRYYVKAKKDREWSAFATAVGLDEGYANQEAAKTSFAWFMAERELPSSLAKHLSQADGTEFARALEEASEHQKPFILWVSACRAVAAEELDRAEELLGRLQRDYPQHSLCVETEFPVQDRKELKTETKTPDAARTREAEKKFAPPVAGSAVGLLRGQIAHLRAFELPAQFRPPAMPEDAPNVRVQLGGDWGGFTITLLPEKAPRHVEEFLKLVDEKFWDGMRIDEIRRPGTSPFAKSISREFHFGLEGSRNDDHTLWVASEPSKHQLEFEMNDLSHFPGAVAGRPEAGGKSCVDRLWICAGDNARQDGQRVIFGYVTEDLAVVKRINEEELRTTGEQEQGIGKPRDYIQIVSITRL